jgi:hypothetical protein
MVMMEAFEEVEEGITVGGRLVKDVRFADDQGIVAATEMGLQRLVDGLNNTAKKYDMKINVKKTNVMVVSREGDEIANIYIDGQRVEQVKQFKYLGAIISENGRCIADVKTKIGMAKEAFRKRRELLTRSLNIDIKKRMVKMLIWPVAMYGCETWTMRKEETDRLRALEMWIWRKVGKVNWRDKRTNEEVLKSVGENRCLVESIVKRKKNWIGHVVRGDGLLKTVLEGRMEGKRPRGRPRMGMIDDLKEGSYVAMKRRAEDREKWRCWMPGPA